MNKKLKIFLIIFFVIILAAVSYLLYIFKFKEYDVADDEVKEIIADPYEIELPDGSKIVIGEDGTVTGFEGEVEAGDEGDSNQTTSPGNTTAGVTPPANDSEGSSEDQNEQPDGATGTDNSDNSSNNTNKKLTVADVKGKYEPVFRELEGQADKKINSLISRAKKEYSDKKAKGESIEYGYFYNKYMSAANNLEANTDAAFQGVIKAVEAELVANGFNKSYAKSFVDEYEATKKARRDSILKKAVGRD